MAESSARISFETSKCKRKRLDQIADVLGIYLSALINEALDQYLELYEWQLDHIQKGVEAARKGDFASEKEWTDFFEKHDNSLYPTR